MDAGGATDEVADLIASIELQRRQAHDENGSKAACVAALRDLEKLLDREQEALRRHGPNSEYPANIVAVTSAIGRVRALGATAHRPSIANSRRTGEREAPRKVATSFALRRRSRGPMGRADR
jgi:hypothetical protein